MTDEWIPADGDHWGTARMIAAPGYRDEGKP